MISNLCKRLHHMYSDVTLNPFYVTGQVGFVHGFGFVV